MRTYLYSFILSLVFISAKAQHTTFEAGFIVLGTDTTRGLLLRTDEVQLGKEVQFKASATSDITTYKPQDIKLYSFANDQIIFQTVELALRKDTTIIKTNRFAKLLLSGYTSLYKLQLEDDELTRILEYNNNKVYILRKDTTFYTLGQFESEVDPQHYKFDKRYISLLTSLTSDCNAVKVDRNLRFEDSKIIEVVKNYNDCKEPNSSKTYSYKVKLINKHGVSASYGTFINFFYSDAFANSNAFSAGYFWDISNPARSKNTSLQTGINYMYLTYSVPFSDQTSEKRQEHYLRLPLLAQKNFYGSQKSLPFINFGLTIQASTDNNFKYVDMIPFIDLGAGVYIKRFKFSLLLENSGFSLRSNKLINFGVGYRLDLLKQL